jgi:hypothetical protein
MLENEQLSTEQILEKYRDDAALLMKYVPYLKKKLGEYKPQLHKVEGEDNRNIMIPIFDSTLLQMAEEVGNLQFMNENYAYVYKKYRMTDSNDELYQINKAGIQNMDLLWGILSKYILKGRVKGLIWQEGVANGVMLAAIQKMNDIILFWTKEDKTL